MAEEVSLILRVARWGNSLCIVIPRPIAEMLQLKRGDYVRVRLRRVEE